VPNRTQIVCLCEGIEGQSIDGVFIFRLMNSIQPGWLRPWPGSKAIRLVPCGGRKEVIKNLPVELKHCLGVGGHTTLMVWADCDDDCDDPEALKAHFWNEAQRNAITSDQFEQVVFIFAKNRIENWIEFLATGSTDESKKGPRVSQTRVAADAARKLASMCKEGRTEGDMPPSLKWSCRNWRTLCSRMRSA
jgi:hypothetical protein